MKNQEKQNKKKTLLSPEEAAEYLHVKETTLRMWRYTKKYKLKYIKVGLKKVLYEQKELDRFLEENNEQ